MAVTGVGFVPTATATIVNNSVPAGHNITVFHNIDFIATFGWPVGQSLTVEVERNGVILGTATGPTVDAAPDGGALEVNHGPEAAPAPGDCFEGHTPDIRPGDLVRITPAGGTSSEVIVDNITFSGPATEAPNGDILVKGVAKRADGTNIPIAFLDSSEFRDTSQFRGAPNSTEVDPAVDGGFIMRYLPPYNLVDGRNTAGLTEAQRKQSLLTSGGHATGFGHVEVLPLEAMLVDGIDDVPGPALGCEAAPAAVDAVDAFADNRLNAARVAAGGNLAISGQSFDSNAVSVTVGTLPAVPATISGASGQQTWTASVPMSSVATLPDGNVTVSMTSTRAAGTIAGVSRTLVKDVVAPAAPTMTPNGGAFPGNVSVSLGGTDTIRYSVGSAAPSIVYTGAFTLTPPQRVNANATDAAGNVSATTTRQFTRSAAGGGGGGAAIIPLSPRIGEADAGKRGGNRTAKARWNDPAANGAVLDGFRVRAVKIRSGRDKVMDAVRVGAGRNKVQMSLPRGQYKFQVRAFNAAGKSDWSQRSNKVRAR